MSPESALAARDAAGLADEAAPALIGPHAVIHLAEVMREDFGPVACDTVLAHAQIDAVPGGTCMIPEIEALRLHRWMAVWDPVACFGIAEEAGRRTADYIFAHRIPGPAVRLLELSPAWVAAPLLMTAIRRHAWTFVGAGRFASDASWGFTIDRRQADHSIAPPPTLFVWYAAVFERLYKRLVDPRCVCRAQSCGAESLVARSYRIECM